MTTFRVDEPLPGIDGAPSFAFGALTSGDWSVVDLNQSEDLLTPTRESGDGFASHTQSIASVAAAARADSNKNPSASAERLANLRRRVTSLNEFMDYERERRRKINHASKIVRQQEAFRFYNNILRPAQARELASVKRLLSLECVVYAQKLNAFIAFQRDGVLSRLEELGRIAVRESETRAWQRFEHLVERAKFFDRVEDDKAFRFVEARADLTAIALQQLENGAAVIRGAVDAHEAAAREALYARTPEPLLRQLRPDRWLDVVSRRTSALSFAQGSPARCLRSPQRRRGVEVDDDEDADSYPAPMVNALTGPVSRPLTLRSTVADLVVEAVASTLAANHAAADGAAAVPLNDPLRVYHDVAAALLAHVVAATTEALDPAAPTSLAVAKVVELVAEKQKHALYEEAVAVLAEFSVQQVAERQPLAVHDSALRAALWEASVRMFNAKRRLAIELEIEAAALHAKSAVEMQEAVGRLGITQDAFAFTGREVTSLAGCSPAVFAYAAVCDHANLAARLARERDLQDPTWSLEAHEAIARRTCQAGCQLTGEPDVLFGEFVGRLHIERTLALESTELEFREATTRQMLKAFGRVFDHPELRRMILYRRELFTRPLSPDTDLEAELGHHEDRHRIEFERAEEREFRRIAVAQSKEWRVIVKVLIERGVWAAN